MDKGQVEAARSLGLSPARTMVWVVIPQAFKIILPPLTNELIALTKDSSLAYVLGSQLSVAGEYRAGLRGDANVVSLQLKLQLKKE